MSAELQTAFDAIPQDMKDAFVPLIKRVERMFVNLDEGTVAAFHVMASYEELLTQEMAALEAAHPDRESSLEKREEFSKIQDEWKEDFSRRHPDFAAAMKTQHDFMQKYADAGKALKKGFCAAGGTELQFSALRYAVLDGKFSRRNPQNTGPAPGQP